VNPYPARIDELHEWLTARYGQRDRQATEILLAQMLDQTVSRRRAPWIIIETDYPSRDTSDAWFSFGGEARPEPRSLAVPRTLRAQKCETILQEWLADSGKPCLFVEAEWRRLPTAGCGAKLLMTTHSYGTVLSACVRVRVEHPRGSHAARSEQDADAAELARLTRRVLDNDHRVNLGAAIADYSASTPESLFYWSELVQRVAPIQTDWEALTGSLVTIARNIGLLYGDGRGPDWRAAERTMRDTIPYTVEWLLGQTSLDKKRGIKAYRLFRESGYGVDGPLVKEIRRLHHTGVLVAQRGMAQTDSFRYYPWKYRMASADWHALVDRTKEILV